MDGLRGRLLRAAEDASREILEVYAGAIEVETKGDGSPVTEADTRSHEALLPHLDDHPVVSEEGRTRAPGGTYWLVDPLDGTKEFVRRNGEFTVNVALMEDAAPVAGVVHVPVTGVTYVGSTEGAWRRADGDWVPIEAGGRPGPLRVVVSRSHRGAHVDAFLRALEEAGHVVRTTAFGSSLKICKVAEGEADVYPRLGPTMAWDTAAAHAVLEAAGGRMTDAGGHPLRYPDTEARNPWFLAGRPGIDWHQFVPPA